MSEEKTEKSRDSKAPEAPKSSAPSGNAPDPTPNPTPDPPKRSEPVYSRERLIAEADVITGHPAHVLVGALNKSDQQEFTADEARAAVEAWLS